MTTLTTSFEGLATGAAIGTTTGSGGDAFTAGSNGTGTAFITDGTGSGLGSVAHGVFAGKMTIPATPATCWRGWTITGPQSFRTYVYLTAYPGAWDVIQAVVAAGPTNVARLRITATGQLQHVNNATAGTATTGVIPLNKLVRIEGTWSTATTATGTFTVEAYLANDTTPIANTSISLTGLTFTAVADQLRFGFPVTGLTSTVYFDGWGVSNTGRLGPLNNPGMSMLVDDFSTKDLIKWFFDTSVSVTGGQATTVPTINYDSGIYGNQVYDLTNDSISVKIIQTPNIGNGSTELQLLLTLGTNDKVFFNISGGSIGAFRKVAGTQTAVGSTVAYNATTTNYLRIRHNGSQIVWEYGNGKTWTQFGYWTPTFAVTALRASIISGFWGTEPSPGTGIIDDVNILPQPQTLATETWTGTTGAAWSAQWTRSGDSGHASSIQSNKGRLTTGSANVYPTAVAMLTGAGLSNNVSVATTFYPTSTTPEQWAFVRVRASGVGNSSWEPLVGYELWCYLTTGGVLQTFLRRYNGAGVTSDLIGMIQPGVAWTTTAGISVRLEAVGATVRYKVWASTSGEPVAWTGTATDASPLGAGQVGIAVTGPSPAAITSIDWDDLTVTNPLTDPYGLSVGSDAPSAWYRFDGDTTDRMGAGPAGVLTNGAAFGTGLLSNYSGQGVTTDGVNDFVPIADHASHRPTANDFTIEAWVKANAWSTGWQTIVTKAAGEYSLQVFNGQAQFRFSLAGVNSALFQTGTMTANAVHHVVGVRSGTTQSIYIDGVLSASQTIANNNTTIGTGGPLRIGSWDGAAEFLNGTVDEVAFYNLALPAAAIAEHYAAGVARAKVEILNDVFTTTDTAKWTWGAAASVVSGQLSLPANSSYTGNIETPVGYDLTDSSISVKVPQRANAGNGGTETYILLYDAGVGLTSKNAVMIDITSTNIGFIRRDSAGVYAALASITYSPTTHLWWRIRAVGRTVYWDTSPDGNTWTQQASWASTIPLSNMKVQLGTGFGGTEPSPGTAIFDNVNNATGVAPMATEYWTGTDSAAWSAQWLSGASGTGAVADLYANRGRLVSTSAGTYNDGNYAYLSGISFVSNFDVTLDVTFPSTADMYLSIMERIVSNPLSSGTLPDNYRFNLSPTGEVILRKSVSGTTTDLATGTAGAWTANVTRRVRFQVFGSTIRCKVWNIGSAEPATWLLSATDSSIAATGKLALKAYSAAAGGNQTVYVDNLFLTPPVAGSSGTFTIWNGTTETTVTLDGVWNGTTITTGITVKLWNGTAEV